MTDPAYPSVTPRFALPLLFPGQAQKEFFVNAALSAADLLLHPAVEGSRADPPAHPAQGETWLIAATATGAWAGLEDRIAGYDAGGWRFVEPVAGLRVYDKATAHYVTFQGTWRRPVAPVEPEGGQTIDVQARDAIVQLFHSLRSAGILSER